MTTTVDLVIFLHWRVAMSKKVLVIGDTHIGEELTGYQYDMLTAISQRIITTLPDYIVLIGDFLTLDSLSEWDKNKRLKMEGRRYGKEIVTGNSALNLLTSGITELNGRLRENHKRQYRPSIIYIEGNHENRLTRHIEANPTFEHHITIKGDLFLEDRGIVWVDYRRYFMIDNVGFTHIPATSRGSLSSSAATISVAKKALQLVEHDVVFGHTHRLEIAHKAFANSNRQITAVNVGCIVDTGGEEYMDGLTEDWWRGIVELQINGNIQAISCIGYKELLNGVLYD